MSKCKIKRIDVKTKRIDALNPCFVIRLVMSNWNIIINGLVSYVLINGERTYLIESPCLKVSPRTKIFTSHQRFYIDTISHFHVPESRPLDIVSRIFNVSEWIQQWPICKQHGTNWRHGSACNVNGSLSTPSLYNHILLCLVKHVSNLQQCVVSCHISYIACIYTQWLTSCPIACSFT